MVKYDSFYYMLEVLRNILGEEKMAFEQSKEQAGNLLSSVQNSSLFNLAVSKLLQQSLLPLYEFIQQKTTIDSVRLKELLEENERLEAALQERSSRFGN